MKSFWSVVLPFTFASPVGIFVGYIISDVAQGTGAAAISALASGAHRRGCHLCAACMSRCPPGPWTCACALALRRAARSRAPPSPAAPAACGAGTFLYVAFMEVIPKELRDPSHMVLKLFMLLLGFSLMSVLAIWA